MRAGTIGIKTVRLAAGRFIATVTALPSRAAALWQRLQPRRFPVAYKLAVTITVVITVGMMLLGSVIMDNQTRLLRQQTNQFGHALIRQLADTIREPLLASDSLTLRTAADAMTSRAGILGTAIYADDAHALVADGLVPPPPQVKSLLQHISDGDAIAATEWRAAQADDARTVITFFTPIVVRELTVGYALVTLDHSQLMRAQHDTLRAITAATVLMVLLGAIASVFIGKRLTRPINELMDASLAISRGDYGFRFDERRNDEIGTLMEAFNTMTAGLLRKEQVEQVFSRYMAPKVAQEVLNDLDQVQLGGQHVEASVLFADIVGFTTMSEKMTPQEVNSLLNEYFDLIAQAAHVYHGHIDKYMGDCAMLVFGVPQYDAQHPLQAVRCAVLIQRLIEALNQRRVKRNEIAVHFHVSCNSGVMLAGNMGSRDRMEYTVVGDAVNLASRLGGIAEAGQIIIAKPMHDLPLLADEIVSAEHATIRLRGIHEPVATYQVLDVATTHQSYLRQQMQHILRRIAGGKVA